MSRSYRKPYSAPTGYASAKKDKQWAARGVRRKQNRWLRNVDDHEAALIPHRLECGWNEVCGWSRDGRQHLMRLSTVDASDAGDPPPWYRKIQRK